LLAASLGLHPGPFNAFGCMAATRCRTMPPCGTIGVITILNLHRSISRGREDQ
jgi:hypothetical protein